MKPSFIDFKPRSRMQMKMPWLIAMSGVLLIVAASVAWQIMTQQQDVAAAMSIPGQHYPSAEEAQSSDIAARSLNLPWRQAMDALEQMFSQPEDGYLTSVEVNIDKMRFKVSGEARDAGLVQALSARLKSMPLVTDAALVRQEIHQGVTPYPVFFTLEFNVRDQS